MYFLSGYILCYLPNPFINLCYSRTQINFKHLEAVRHDYRRYYLFTNDIWPDMLKVTQMYLVLIVGMVKLIL